MRLIERLKEVGAWLDARLQLGKPVREAATHRVPRRTASWFYVFGSASLTLFILQVVTGICLALVYVPSADERVEQPAASSTTADLRLVHPRAARLGLELHGRDRPPPHGARCSCSALTSIRAS